MKYKHKLFDAVIIDRDGEIRHVPVSAIASKDSPLLVVHRELTPPRYNADGREWRVSHAPTGHAVCSTPTATKGLEIISKIVNMFDWSHPLEWWKEQLKDPEHAAKLKDMYKIVYEINLAR
jgi:hypothetical protein